MTARWGLCLGAALFLCGAALPRAARAEGAADVAAARELFTAAAADAKEGRWEEARQKYARALALKRSPAIVYGLALAQSHTGRFVDAIENYKAFLIEAKADDPYRDTAKAQVAELEPRVGRLEISLAPGAPWAVSLDGVAIPEAARGLPRRVDPGRHAVAVRAEGFKPMLREVEVAPGKSVKLELVLEAAPERRREPRPPGEAPRPLRRDFVPGGAVLGSGVALFAAGLGVGLSGVVDAGAAPTRDGPAANDARLRMNVGDVLGGVGAAVGVVGVALLVYEAVKPARTQAPVVVGRAGLGLSF